MAKLGLNQTILPYPSVAEQTFVKVYASHPQHFKQ
jgi:hypothetical protein